MPVEWQSFPVGPLQCNCTVVADTDTKQGIVVDPGGSIDKIVVCLKKLGVEQVTHVLVTHGHFDHFMAAAEISDRFDAPVHLHEADVFLWQRVPAQCRDFGCPPPEREIPLPKCFVTHNQELLASPLLRGRVLHTPGHTPGSCCFHFAAQDLLCSGDTLFKSGVGRTSWAGIPSLEGTSDARQLKQSIVKELLPLADQTTVISGHGPSTSIGRERISNPYLG
eukprot:TRINITY_DN56012_c0_g1_i1.p1 TRINITY_DN56012_c0_g1~~TRINITY_DN56012_c0_g1_i1.p1  ORF type:complete len:229 (+),score=24.02 TRINITY_DN56012_c0_g1_i1:24-689(+)